MGRHLLPLLTPLLLLAAGKAALVERVTGNTCAQRHPTVSSYCTCLRPPQAPAQLLSGAAWNKSFYPATLHCCYTEKPDTRTHRGLTSPPSVVPITSVNSTRLAGVPMPASSTRPAWTVVRTCSRSLLPPSRHDTLLNPVHVHDEQKHSRVYNRPPSD